MIHERSTQMENLSVKYSDSEFFIYCRIFRVVSIHSVKLV